LGTGDSGGVGGARAMKPEEEEEEEVGTG